MSDKHKISQDGNLPTLVVCCITTEGATKKSRSPTDERLASVFTKEANHRDDKPFAQFDISDHKARLSRATASPQWSSVPYLQTGVIKRTFMLQETCEHQKAES